MPNPIAIASPQLLRQLISLRDSTEYQILDRHLCNLQERAQSAANTFTSCPYQTNWNKGFLNGLTGARDALGILIKQTEDAIKREKK